MRFYIDHFLLRTGASFSFVSIFLLTFLHTLLVCFWNFIFSSIVTPNSSIQVLNFNSSASSPAAGHVSPSRIIPLGNKKRQFQFEPFSKRTRWCYQGNSLISKNPSRTFSRNIHFSFSRTSRAANTFATLLIIEMLMNCIFNQINGAFHNYLSLYIGDNNNNTTFAGSYCLFVTLVVIFAPQCLFCLLFFP